MSDHKHHDVMTYVNTDSSAGITMFAITHAAFVAVTINMKPSKVE